VTRTARSARGETVPVTATDCQQRSVLEGGRCTSLLSEQAGEGGRTKDHLDGAVEPRWGQLSRLCRRRTPLSDPLWDG